MSVRLAPSRLVSQLVTVPSTTASDTSAPLRAVSKTSGYGLAFFVPARRPCQVALRLTTRQVLYSPSAVPVLVSVV